MTSRNNTRRALTASLLSLVLCFAMLIGTTFAWFTDSVKSGNNKIQAGMLNIDLLVRNENGEYQSIKESEAAIFDYTLWEPGYTVVKNVKVSTTGNLALKYTMSIVAKGEVSKLAEVIDVYYAAEEVEVTDRNLTGLKKLGTLKDVFDGAAGTVIHDTLIPGENPDDYATIALKMQETAGNDYQGLSIGEFDLQILATQFTYEKDSFDDSYDANATNETELVKYTFSSAADEDAFCPACYNAGTTSDHASHPEVFVVEDGVAKIGKEGAWRSFSDLDWLENQYRMEYDVDLAELSDGAMVAFNIGEMTSWTDLQVAFQRTGDTITAYNTLFENSLVEGKKLGEIGEKVHVSYSFAEEGSRLTMTMVISDGEHRYTVERTAADAAKIGELGWCVYTTVNGQSYGSIDNLVFSAAYTPKTVGTADDFNQALAAGGKISVTENMDAGNAVGSKFTVTKDTVIIGNGRQITTCDPDRTAYATRIFDMTNLTESTTLSIINAKLTGESTTGEPAYIYRGISLYANQNPVLNIEDSEIKVGHYAINVASENINSVINVKNSALSGYAAFQTHSTGTTATFSDSTLAGINQWNGDGNGFASVVVNAGAGGSTLTFDNCTIEANQNGTAWQQLMQLRAGCTVNLNNCTFKMNGVEIDRQEILDDIKNSTQKYINFYARDDVHIFVDGVEVW